MPRVGVVTADFVANTAQFQEGAERARRSLKQFEAQAANTRKMVAGLFAGISVAGVVAGLRAAVTEGDKLAKLAVRLGATTEALSQLQYVAERSGVEFQTMTQGLQKLTLRVAEAATGNADAAATFTRLGLSVRDLAGLRPEDQFLAVARAMDGVTNSGERVRVAVKLFEQEGAALLQTMEAGAAGIEALMLEADRLGVTLTRETAAAMVKASDEMARFDAQATALGRNLATDVLPPLNDLLGKVNELFEALRQPLPKTGIWFLDATLPGTGPATSGTLEDYELPPTMLPPVVVTPPPGAAALSGRAGDPFKAQREELRRLEEDLRALSPQIERMGEKLIELTSAGLNSGADFNALTAQMDQAVSLESEITAQIERIRNAIGEAAPAALDVSAYEAAVTAAGGTLAQLAEARRIVEASLTPVQRYVEAFAELTRLRAQFPAIITPEVANNYIAQLQEQLTAASDGTREMSSAAQELGWAFSSAFESAALAGEGLRGVLKGLLDDLARIILRQTVTAPLAAAVAGSVAGMFPGFAAGGPVSGGRPIIVGEQGPELFVPRGNGTIVPNHAMGGMAVTVNNHAAGYEARVSEGPGGLTIDIVRAMLAGDLTTGGQTWTRALDGRVGRGF